MSKKGRAVRPGLERLIRGLMWIYPRSFRREHGDALLRTYLDVCRDSKTQWRSTGHTWAWLLRDALSTAVRVRFSRTAHEQTSRKIHGNGGGEGMKAIVREMRLAVRSLARTPTFATEK